MKIFNSPGNHSLQNNKLLRFYKNNKGAASVEFTLILPIFLILYFGVIEILSIVETKKNLRQIATTVLRSFEHMHYEVTKEEILNVINVSKFIINKKHRQNLEINVGVIVPNATTKKPTWSMFFPNSKNPKSKLMETYFTPTELNSLQTTFYNITTQYPYLSFASASLVYNPILLNFTPLAKWKGIRLMERLISRTINEQPLKCTNCS